MIEFRCHKCDKLLARIDPSGRTEIVCPRCKSKNDSADYVVIAGRLVRRDMVRDDIYLSEAQRISTVPMDASKVTVMTEEEYLEQFKNL